MVRLFKDYQFLHIALKNERVDFLFFFRGGWVNLYMIKIEDQSTAVACTWGKNPPRLTDARWSWVQVPSPLERSNLLLAE